MTRPAMEDVLVDFAVSLSRRSTCERLVHVGCVVASWDLSQVVGVGYNGQPRGFPHDMCDPKTPGGCGCVHAESNALIKSPYDRGPLQMFVTLSPCDACARLIVNSAVKRVTYVKPYRTLVGTDLLRMGGIEVVHHDARP